MGFKERIKEEFRSNYKEFYPIEALQELGFNRGKCESCGKTFWSKQKDRENCGEAKCIGGYQFIGEDKINDFDYFEAYELHKEYYEDKGYKEISRYPVVSRWFPGHHFVEAGINLFQPFVVSGQVDPIHRRTIEGQFCLRFNDIENVGLTGSHYTGFVMVGHHVFNEPGADKEDEDFCFKEKGVKQFVKFFTDVLGVPEEELILHEDAWSGGSNFGPSIEFFAYGLELGNQVYMEYERTSEGRKELDMKIIDMGSGLERWAWVSSGKPMSYDVIFKDVMEYLYENTDLDKDKCLFESFSKYAAFFNIDEVDDIEEMWDNASDKLEVPKEELKEKIKPFSALYSIAEHMRTFLVAFHDGELPSNVGGGYNIRNILRRCFYFIDKYDFDIDLKKVVEIHMDEFGEFYPEVREVSDAIFEVIDLERERYDDTLSNAERLVDEFSEKEEISLDKMVELYESEGLTPEIINEVDSSVEIPQGFYLELEKLRKSSEEKEVKKEGIDVSGFEKTELEFYEEPDKIEFEAEVLGQVEDYLILNKTCFYPEMGGQKYDLGSIEGVPLNSVKIQDGVVLHELSKDIDLSKGDKVSAKVDEERRRKLSRTHSAVHVLLRAAREVLGNYVNQASAEKTVEKGKLDITHYKNLSFEELQEIERVANEIGREGVETNVEAMDRSKAEDMHGVDIYQGGAVPDKEIRIVDIADNVQACGGMHVSNTQDIGFVKLFSHERIKDGVVRLEFMIGEDAVDQVQENEKILHELTEMWDISYEEIPKTAKKFFEGWKELKKENKKLKIQLSREKVKRALNRESTLVEVKLPLDEFGLLMKVGKEFESELGERAILMKGSNFAYGISNVDDVNMEKKIETLCEKVEGDESEAKGFKLKD